MVWIPMSPMGPPHAMLLSPIQVRGLLSLRKQKLQEAKTGCTDGAVSYQCAHAFERAVIAEVLGHAQRPASSVACGGHHAAAASAVFIASGFSQRTALPWRNASRVCSQCSASGVATKTTSMAGEAQSSSGEAKTCSMPCCAAFSLGALLIAAPDARQRCVLRLCEGSSESPLAMMSKAENSITDHTPMLNAPIAVRADADSIAFTLFSDTPFASATPWEAYVS